jgi:hypothetical protein
MILESIDNLARALETGGYTTTSSLVPGMELKIESLDVTMKMVVFTIDDIGRLGPNGEPRPILYFADRFIEFQWNARARQWDQVRAPDRTPWLHFFLGRPRISQASKKRLTPYKLRKARRELVRRMAQELAPDHAVHHQGR